MTDRVSWRPQLDLPPAATDREQFQNKTLRPVLKLQHAPLLQVFRHYLTKRKVAWQQLAQSDFKAKTEELLSRDNRLRGLLFGMLLGCLTEAELTYYLDHESEMNRRITSMLTERILDGMRAFR